MSPTGRSAPSGIPGNSGGTPLGIKIICVLGGITSLIGVIGGMALLGGSGFGVAPGASGVVGIVTLLVSVISLVAYYGLWKLEYWAWVLYMIVGGLDVLVDLANVEILGVIIGVVILAYVYSKRDLYEANR